MSTQSDHADKVQAFVNDVAARLGKPLPNPPAVTRLGSDADMVTRILRLVAGGDKTGTFTLPWLTQHAGKPDPAPGDVLVLTDMDGAPRIATQLTVVQEVRFDEISEEHTAVDGPAIREVGLWKSIHAAYWGDQLSDLGRKVEPHMPVRVMHFNVLHAQLP